MIYETKEFKEFKNSLAAVFYKGSQMTGYIDMHIIVSMSKKSDTGNIEKAIGDTLESTGIIENDKYIRNITFERHYHPISGRKNKYYDLLVITLTEVENQEIIKEEQETDKFGSNYKGLIEEEE